MRKKSFFKVAGLAFSVALPEGWDASLLLPSFLAFRCKAYKNEELIFRLRVTIKPFSGDDGHTELLDDSSNDMGHVRLWRNAGGYRIEVDNNSALDRSPHVLLADSAFTSADVYLRPSDPSVGRVLSSLIRIFFSQAVLAHGGVSVHASCVRKGDKSYLFLGKSGTGKSTHSVQWMETFSDCSLLNDDNPVLRISDGIVTAYGTPWSGKTPCYKNAHYPVAGIVRLQQSPVNRFTPLSGAEAFIALLPSCSGIRRDVRLSEALYSTLIRVAEDIPFGRLECRPDHEAAELCLEGISSRCGKPAECSN